MELNSVFLARQLFDKPHTRICVSTAGSCRHWAVFFCNPGALAGALAIQTAACQLAHQQPLPPPLSLPSPVVRRVRRSCARPRRCARRCTAATSAASPTCSPRCAPCTCWRTTLGVRLPGRRHINNTFLFKGKAKGHNMNTDQQQGARLGWGHMQVIALRCVTSLRVTLPCRRLACIPAHESPASLLLALHRHTPRITLMPHHS